jgi:hypothetical protein
MDDFFLCFKRLSNKNKASSRNAKGKKPEDFLPFENIFF